MKKQQRTHLHHSEIELDDLRNLNCEARKSAHFSGSESRLNSVGEEPDAVIDGCRVTRNVQPTQVMGENTNEVHVTIVKNEEMWENEATRNATDIQDKDGENKNVDNNASGKNGEFDSHQVARNVAPIQDENGDTRNDFNRASRKNRKFDEHQVTRNLSPIVDTKEENRNGVNIASGSCNLQIICPPDRDQCNPEESTQVLRRDILHNQYLSEEDKRKVGVIANKKYFLDKGEFQLKCSSELDARHYPSKLNNSQAFFQSSNGVDKEYCRRDSTPRELTHGESTLEQGVVDQQHSRNINWEYLHSQGVNRVTFWLIMGALLMTFLTAVSVVILWEHLSTVSLERRLCSNSSKIPIMPDIVFPRTW